VDTELACEADPIVDRKTAAMEGTRPTRGRKRGRRIVCGNHQEAEKDGDDRAQWPSVPTRSR
jgi:hypothetical protein